MTGGGGGMMGMMAGPGPNITGSLKFSTILGNALSSQIKVGLNQSAMAAEKAIGNNSHAVASTFWDGKWTFGIYCMGYRWQL